MTSLESLIEQPLVHRFGLTLLHFLWQGAAVAVVMAVVLRWLRRRSAHARYLASVVGLGLMAVLPVVTFSLIEVLPAPSGEAGRGARGEMHPWESPPDVDPVDSLPAPVVAEGLGEQGPDLFSEADSTPSGLDPASTAREPLPSVAGGWASTNLARVARWVDDLRPLLPWVVCAWAVGVLSFSARLASGWLCVVRLKRHSMPMVADPLVRMVRRLSTQLGIRRPVTLLQSTLVAVPSSVGFLRPVILLPVSTLMGLSPEQLESVLAHELAHVRRYDYLVNVLQCIVETLLFYHPAVWWMSRRIRAERENCCDDLAVSVVGSRLVYAQALVDVATLGKRQQPLTAAADGADLASRIRRVMAIAPAESHKLSSWWVGAVLLLILIAVTLVVSLGPAAPSARAGESDPSAGEKDVAAAADPEADAKQPADKPQFRLFDEFDGKLELDWEVIRPNPERVSLSKNPGRLTITSELGGLHSAVKTGISAKNVHMIPNPAVAGGDFVVTTCLEGFHPEAPYQQAGPHIYDDDDNYFKAIVARNMRGVLIGCAWEAGGEFGGLDLKVTDLEWDRLWLRIVKRGRAYESSYSLDGENYTVIAERLWGDGSPQRVGIAVMNEDASSNPLDAAFDYFEVRSLTDEEKNDPVYLERQKLHGMWEVVSARLGGEAMEESPWSRFEFHGTEVTFYEKGEHLTSKYALDPDKEPKGLTLTGVSREMWKGHTREFFRERSLVNAIYSIEQERLVICMAPRPGDPAPTELETKEGDGRVLAELRPMSEVEIAAIERSSLSPKQLVNRLDADGDGQLTLDEFIADWPTPEAAKQGTEVFRVIDQDRDGKMTVDEFGSKPTRAVFLLMDFNADAALSFGEFSLSPRDSVRAAQTTRIFALVDQDHDGAISSREYTSRPAEAWFIKLDANDDQRLSLEEYVKGNSHLVQSGHVERVFRLLDHNGDGRLEAAEYAQQPAECSFLFRDADGDGRLTFREFCHWWHTPEQVAAAKEEFGRKDADGDALLSFREYAYRSDDAEFWNADQDGDDRLSLEEFTAGQPSQDRDEAEADFQSIDQNHDRSISLGEFKTRPAAEDPKGVGDAR